MGKKKIWTNNQRLINKKEALIRAYRKLSARHELISFSLGKFYFGKTNIDKNVQI